MTDDTAPKLAMEIRHMETAGEESSRFYYQCTMPKNSADPPWI